MGKGEGERRVMKVMRKALLGLALGLAPGLCGALRAPCPSLSLSPPCVSVPVLSASYISMQSVSRRLKTTLNQEIVGQEGQEGLAVPRPIKSWLNAATNLFPAWVLGFSMLGYKHPTSLKWFNPFITQALTLTMVGMGMTLSLEDFKNVLKSWRYVLVGFLAQYTVMPLASLFSARLFNLSPELTMGLILVGCAPGGTASNLVTMIAKADVALSILMTTTSTFAAVFMTPLLIMKLGERLVSIRPMDLVASAMNVVLFPVIFGLILNTRFPILCQQLSQITPFLSVLLVALICGSVSAANSHVLVHANGLKLLGAVLCLHTIGFGVGYLFAKLFRADEEQSRTIR
jgi:bile acid:Na+ symporter, BASS family